MCVAAASTQTPCAAGAYQPLPGQAGCTLASLGYYVPRAGATLQIPCPLGTTSTVQGATGCTALPVLNIDNSYSGTGYDAATDGVLLLRYLFGLRGTALVANARGSGASLRDAAQIETYLGNNLALFDVDGDGQTLAMTDGLMILRRLLNPGMPTSNAAAMSAIVANVKCGVRTDVEAVIAIDALKP